MNKATLGSLILGATGVALIVGACIIDDDITFVIGCGEEWTTQTPGATGLHPVTQQEIDIEENGQAVEVSFCLTKTVGEDADDPQSDIYATMQTAAVAACEARAIVMGLDTPYTCDTSVDDPFYDTKCHLFESECDPDEDGTGSTAGDGFPDVGDEISCDAGVCTVSLQLIADVRAAPLSTWEEDGVELDLVSGRGGPVGWQFSNITSGTLAGELGFQNDDIATEIDGIPLTSSAALLESADYAMNEDSIVITYKRSFSTRTLTIEKEPPT